jgi:hypothetical protein
MIVIGSISSIYSSILTDSHPTYSRRGRSAGNFYYETIGVVVNVNGSYTFTSQSQTDVYGYFYRQDFDYWNPSENLMTANDDSGSGAQFLLSPGILQSSEEYILVFTTYSAGVRCPFSVVGSGPGLITYTNMTSFSRSKTPPALETTTTASKCHAVINAWYY